MNFEHKHHEETHSRVGRYLGELFDAPHLDDETGHYHVGYGSTILEVSVEPYGPEETIVLVTAYCVQGADIDTKLMKGLLQLNHDLPVGAFSIVDSDIFFSQSLFGRELERNNLLGTIAAVATTGDDYDDRIVSSYGGQTALAKIRDTGGRAQRRRESESKSKSESESE